MKVGLGFLINFTSDLVQGASAWRGLTNTEDGLSVTVSKSSTSVVKFRFFDALRTRRISPTKETPETSDLSKCSNILHFTERLSGATNQTSNYPRDGILPAIYTDDKTQEDNIEYIAKPSNAVNACRCGLHLLVFVKSAISHSEQREGIRRTWAKVPNVSVNFVLGIPTSEPVAHQNFKQILQESAENRDMLVSRFSDTYSNLTKKSKSALKWSSEECGNYAYLALVDDDIALDVAKIASEVARREERFSGNVAELEHVQCLHRIQNRARVMRQGKWAVSRTQYPNEFYPQVCTGAGMLMSNRAVDALHSMSKKTAEFEIDDVFISGILRVKSRLAIRGPGVFRNGTLELVTDVKPTSSL